MEHCVGYGKLTTPTSITAKTLSPQATEDNVNRGINSEWADNSSTIGILSATAERSAQHTEGIPAAEAAAATEVEVMAAGGVQRTSVHGATAFVSGPAVSGPRAMAPVPHSLRADGSKVPGGDAWRGGERSTATQLLEASACLALSVRCFAWP